MHNNTYIVTRLNLKMTDYRPLNDEYIKYRLNLYNISTKRSIYNQTDRNCTHIVFSDVSLSEEMKEYTKQICNQVEFIEYEGKEWSNKYLSDYLHKITPEGDMITTINIDSDDLLHKDFVKEVNKRITSYKENDFPVLMFTQHHYLYSTKRGIDIINPTFINESMSFSEINKPYITVFKRGHANMGEEAKTIIKIENTPICMIVNNSNYCSRYFENWRKQEKINVNLEELYGINKKELDEFLNRDLPEQFIKEEETIRNIRRSKINRKKPII